MIIRQTKSLFLTCLLLAIFYSAHFEGATASHLWRALDTFGLSISMTPVTSDMALLSSPTRSQAIYTRSFALTLKDSTQKEISFPFEKLSFHQEKMPILLLLELMNLKADERLHLRALCWSFQKRIPNLESFRFDVEPPDPLDLENGLNLNYSCREETN